MDKGIIVALVLIGVIGLYIVTYIWNKNTQAPPNMPVVSGCSTCASSGSCSLAKKEIISSTDDQSCDSYDTV